MSCSFLLNCWKLWLLAQLYKSSKLRLWLCLFLTAQGCFHLKMTCIWAASLLQAAHRWVTRVRLLLTLMAWINVNCRHGVSVWETRSFFPNIWRLETYYNNKMKKSCFFLKEQYQDIHSLLAKEAQLNWFAPTDNMTSWDYLSPSWALSGK